MARASNGPGAATARAVQKTITVTREVVPAAENSQTQETEDQRDPFEFMESIPAEEWEQQNYSVYLYRVEPKTTRGYGEANLGVYSRPFTLEWLRNTYGGETFRIVVKRGAQRVFDKRVVIELPPKYAIAERSPDGRALPQPGPAIGDQSAAATIGSKAIDALADRETRAVGIAMDAVAKAAEVISKPPPSNPLFEKLVAMAIERFLSPPAPPPPPPTNPLVDRLIGAAIDRFVAGPTPTPIMDPIVGKLVETAIQRFMSGAAGRERTDIAIELARQVPNALQSAERIVHGWSVGKMAERDRVALEKGAVVAGTLPTPAASPPPATGPQSTPAAVISGPSLEWIEQKIVEIVMEPSSSSEEAAEEALIYLDRESPVLAQQLVQLGEQGVMQLFRTRPTLQAVPQNERLVEFVRKFLALAQEPPLAPGPPEGTPPA